MKISDFLCEKATTANLTGKSKEEVIQEMVDLLVKAGEIDKKFKKKIFEALMAREALGSTAIGQGIAIPHAKYESVKKLVGCLGVSKDGINFDSLDGEPAYIFFLLVAPVDSAGPHLKALARISRLLKDKFIRESLKNATDETFILKIVHQEDDRLSKL
ncbi:MAG: PTS sugar transporter subunit IIA [Candidatus Omnitrophica bacterium]|nr:PTS sugar transporter subunit IIA [Candidatus Omnitrophota bacterium]MCB9746825.1 PTS sugar transporter subunit IIA [Candidatus Omnitrophota bacterium]